MISSSEFLVDHAYRKVWCSPGQDRQHIVAPSRMSKSWGAIGSINIGMRTYSLPTQGEWYHVFVIGDLPPVLVGMGHIEDNWVNARAHCNDTSLLVTTYLNDGKVFPTHRVYFLYTRNGSMVVAFKHTPKVANLGKEQPFIRWRSNAWFDRVDAEIAKDAGIFVEGIVYQGQAEFSSFQSRWRARRDSGVGAAFAYVNGLRVKDINISTAQVGDILEYVWDASVKEVLEMRVGDLKSFDSIRDNKAKFLIPRPGLGDVIDYRDDVDFFLLNYELAAKYKGLYYHQNLVDSVRNVTHRDFSLPFAYLRGYVDNSPEWRWDHDLRVEVVVRHSGWMRELVDEHHRIKELFKLEEEDRLDVMIGEQSLVSVWRAAELENSPYIRIMDSLYGEITRSLVREAYGYNAISRLVGDTPKRLLPGQEWLTLPMTSMPRSTVFEYDGQGRLIDWYKHSNSFEYPIRNTTARYVEAYSGFGDVGLYTEYDRLETVLDPSADYRFYICDKWNGEARNNWRDVTGDTTKYVIENGTAKWLIDPTKYLTAVRSDRGFLCYTVDLNYRDDLITLTVRSTDIVIGQVPSSGVMDIPPGEIDIFLNGWDLVEDVDFYVEWPQICIINKSRLVPGPIQRVVVRGRGFCDSELKRRKPKDVGFVSYGKLSRNARFQVRDDKVTRVSIAGALFTREEVVFSEDGTVVSPVNVLNGAPYKITHPVIPMLDVTAVDTYELMAISEAVDKEVEDYLTLKLPEPVEPLPSPALAWYLVFSPFSAKLIYDMLYGVLPMDEFKGEYSDQFLRERLRGYEWILPFDPALRGVDERYVNIQPHPEVDPIHLTVYQYRLLDRAIQLFLNGKVQINRHTLIIEEGYEHETPDHPHPHRTFDEIGA